MNFSIKSILLCLLAMFSLRASAQLTQRFTGEQPAITAAPAMRTVPCNGDSIFHEGFDTQIPGNFLVLDLDTLTPQPALQLTGGWQYRLDYNDSLNGVAVTPSWYTSQGPSDDWLITPQISLGTNTCISWAAYSQDRFFPEAYEVRISTTTPDTAGFFANPPVDSIAAEQGDYEYRTANLSDYAGQNVYLAFRQVSDDQFVLVLDDIYLANVEQLDAGVYDFSSNNNNPGDTARFSIEFANYGTDTLDSVTISYSVDGGPVKSIFRDSLGLPPNESATVLHDSIWETDTLDKFYTVCSWTSAPNGSADQRSGNDTLCLQIAIGAPIAITPPKATLPFRVYPNPASGRVMIRMDEFKRGEVPDVWIMDGLGRSFRPDQDHWNGKKLELDLTGFSTGIYFIRVIDAKGQSGTQKLILR